MEEENNLSGLKREGTEKVCSNCEHQLGEECAIDGHEVWDESTCDNFTGDFHSH